MTTPAFLTDVERDERAELEAALGVSLTPPPDATDAARDAYVSDLLRALGEAKRNVSRYEDACAAEVLRIMARYEAMAKPDMRRAELLEAAIHVEAMAADFGRKKSRDVGYGTYGRKQVPEKVEVRDGHALLEWAILEDQRMIEHKITRTVRHRAVENYYHTTGDIPPGVEVVAAHDEAFARPLVSP